MKKITIYSSTMCPFCIMAKKFLDSKKLSYTEINLSQFPQFREEMLKKSHGLKTVPQIFIEEVHIGGCTDLLELNKNGTLEKMLK